MADTRINALSLATVSETTDYLPIDGGTGTRKLSAFSPSFGGNATVGGTLTVSGTGSSTVAGKLVVNPLIAATKSVEIQIAHAINTENYLRVASDNGTSFGAEYGYGLTGVGDPEIRINRLHAGTVTNVLKIRTTNGAATLAGSLSITDTTASTSTSSGALVVSGGVGVAGAIYCGSLNATADSKISSAAAKTSSADTLKIATATGGSSDFELLISRSAAGSGAYYSIQSVEQATGYRGLALQKDGGNVLIGTTSDSGQRLQVSGTANITGAISIGNTVNTVSPTAPNRTITMVINGTTYYLHAKTTND